MFGLVRLAVANDRAAIESIVAAAYGHYEDRLGRKPAPMLADYEAIIRKQRAWVLEDRGEVMGLIVLVATSRSLLLQNVAVHPSFQGRGLGKSLLSFAEDLAIAKGCSSIELYTNELMVENIEIYGRRGYRETGRATDDGFRRVYMTKDLRSP